MSIKITTPLMTICGKDGKPVKGVAKCSSDLEVAEKLAVLPTGTVHDCSPTGKNCYQVRM